MSNHTSPSGPLMTRAMLARELGLPDMTVRSRITRLGVQPDERLRVSPTATAPLFAESRLAELAGLLGSPVRPDLAMH